MFESIFLALENLWQPTRKDLGSVRTIVVNSRTFLLFWPPERKKHLNGSNKTKQTEMVKTHNKV